MKLLILTQTVDRHDPYLGFFHSWLIEIARHYERVTVIALRVGEYDLPGNVEVLSLGKEVGASRVKYIYRLYTYMWGIRHNYDTVFVHMVPIYVVLVGLIWRMSGKKIYLWYTHKHVDCKLKIAAHLAHGIVTASPESFQAMSNKIRIIGHGIDVAAFACPIQSALTDVQPLRLVTVGRITPIKDLATLIRVLPLVAQALSRSVELKIVGGEVYDGDKEYRKSLELLIDQLGVRPHITFTGPVPQNKLPAYYCEADFSVNLCPTGGMDKAVLESCAAGRPVFVANETFRDYFEDDFAKRLIFKHGDHEDLARVIVAMAQSSDVATVGSRLVTIAQTKSTVEGLVKKLVKYMS